MTEVAEALATLLRTQEALPRGPKREGVFALWLFARVALEIGESADGMDRSDRKRCTLLGRRLAPLAVPRPLGRGLTGALGILEAGTPQSARVALSQLVAPARDSIDHDVGEAVAVLARHLHTHQSGATP
ncbi:MAG TPA: hypothetical protein VFN22_11285 [Gemmatimonadales bacterium]|nr:hypothetical protein [Gemmatimonadales bacterium]